MHLPGTVGQSVGEKDNQMKNVITGFATTLGLIMFAIVVAVFFYVIRRR